MRRIIFFTIVSVLSFISCKRDTKNEMIRISVERHLEMYPKSTLQDLYKNFFQDYFGPGHMVNDTTSAGAYLNGELVLFEQSSGRSYEATGYNGNFYRVDLSVICEGFISRDAYFDAFIRSVTNIQTISLDEWKDEWKQIDLVIQMMNLSLPDYEQDRNNLFSLLEQGKYVVHHSDLFSENYDPHYRIIEKEIFLNEILPLLQ